MLYYLLVGCLSVLVVVLVYVDAKEKEREERMSGTRLR